MNELSDMIYESSEINTGKIEEFPENDEPNSAHQNESIELENIALEETQGRITKPTSENCSDPAMDRVQNAFKAQLLRRKERLEQELREERIGLQNAKKEREDCGVELYGMQKQLANLQSSLDGSAERHKEIVENRNKSDDKLAELRSKLNQKCSEKDKLGKEIAALKDDAHKVENMLKNALKFNQETKKEVEIRKRMASKAEEIVKTSEKSKEAQDLYIDGLVQQVKDIEGDVSLLNESIDVHRTQNKESDALLQDLSNELNELLREKKHLCHQWNSSVLALGRRDQALVAVLKATEKISMAVNDNESELTALKKETITLTKKRESIEFHRNKINNELVFLDESISKIQWEQETISSQIEMISKIIVKSKEEQLNVERAAKRLKSDADALSRKIELVSNQRRQVENE